MTSSEGSIHNLIMKGAINVCAAATLYLHKATAHSRATSSVLDSKQAFQVALASYS